MRHLVIALYCCCTAVVSGLIPHVPEAARTPPTCSSMTARPPTRRAFVAASFFASAVSFLTMTSSPIAALAAGSSSSSAMPMISTDEFMLVLRDSSRSIAQVDIYNGARVVVQLLDGTSFGLNDVVESSTDPRSTLKIAALCREAKVPCKFVDIEAALLNSATTKRKNYANSRVQEAAVREKERFARMQKDEEERLRELQRMQQ